MQYFMNSKDSIVNQAIDGMVAVGNANLLRFPDDHAARVVVRSDWDKSKVAIISGGGSGHEPAHAGFVGKGLLTAAVCGEVFASPSIDAVLAGILAVTGDAGCLLVVKNYTGDRLNFGLAAEKAKALGLKVEMVIIADDVALPQAAQPRGIAGTLFIHKIAGHLSETGATLDRVVNMVNQANRGIASIGFARDTCRVPGNPKEDRIGPMEVEIGLGIHGEPGVELAEYSTSRSLIAEVANRLQSARNNTSERYAVMLNNLGGLSGIEASVLTQDFMSTELAKQVDYVIGPQAMMTALDMPGFSISILALDPAMLDCLFSETEVTAWPGMVNRNSVQNLPAPALPKTKKYTASTNAVVRATIERIANTCLAIEDDINALDAKVGDGDTGSTFASAARTVHLELDKLPLAEGARLLHALSEIKTRSMGGSSGVLFAILFSAAAEEYASSNDWVSALRAGLKAMQKYGGAKIGDRTMIDALAPALVALQAGDGINIASKRARSGANATAEMKTAKAGRSAYLDERSLMGVADPGAEAIARIFEALAG